MFADAAEQFVTYGVLVAVASATVLFILRLLWRGAIDTLREAIREPAVEAAATASRAAATASQAAVKVAEVKDAIGIPNGEGNITEMMESQNAQLRLLTSSLANMQEVQTQMQTVQRSIVAHLKLPEET